MATSMTGVTLLARQANADLSAKLFYVAKLVASTGYADLCGNGGRSVGVIVEAAASGGIVSIQMDGIAKVIAGGTISAGAKLQSDGNGKAITYSSGDAIGVALSDAASGDIFPMMLGI